MRPKTVVVSLPVEDPERSLRFYRDGLQLSTDGVEDGIVLFELPNLSLFLIERGEYARYAERAGFTSSTPVPGALIVSCAIGSKDELDDVLSRVVAAGGSVPQPADTYDGSYMGYFTDPDGHLWELVFNARTESTPAPGADA
ncbi:VOC family protein [Nocardia sp. NPDC058176]|uniref:VOC family protein n=1 Tax=Nocardia sp. NPDC058176 TaxID=3346368 RepID=UPI0036D9F74E